MKLPICRLILIGCVLSCLYVNFYLVCHYLLKNLEKEAKIGHWPVILHAILIEGGFLEKGRGEKTWADLKCEGKEPFSER